MNPCFNSRRESVCRIPNSAFSLQPSAKRPGLKSRGVSRGTFKRQFGESCSVQPQLKQGFDRCILCQAIKCISYYPGTDTLSGFICSLCEKHMDGYDFIRHDEKDLARLKAENDALRGRIVLIFAGTFAQAKEYMREHSLSPRDAAYITDRHSIMGLENPEVIRIGTWYERHDRDEIELQIKLMTR